MEQEQQSLPGQHSFQRQPRTSSRGQRMFWSVFWSSLLGTSGWASWRYDTPTSSREPTRHHHHEMSRRNPGKSKHTRQRFPVSTSLILSHSTGKTSTCRCRILGKSDRFPFSCKQSGRGDLSDRLSAQGSRIERTCGALQLNGQLVAQPVGYASR